MSSRSGVVTDDVVGRWIIWMTHNNRTWKALHPYQYILRDNSKFWTLSLCMYIILYWTSGYLEGRGEGVNDTLLSYTTDKKQETAVRLSCVHPAEHACLQELLKRLQDRHNEYVQVVAKKADADVTSPATVSPDTPMSQIHQSPGRRHNPILCDLVGLW
jgi:hypothetical protein